MTEAGLRIFKKKKKRTRKCLFEKAPKKNCKCADETSERERMRERMKEARESIEGKTYKREREGEGERESLTERKSGRGDRGVERFGVQ